MPKFYITEREIVDAINEMKSHSAVPQSAIPTRIFKECKWSLSLPLRLFWEKSFKSGLVPSAYKFHQTIPKHKKGPKSSPSNFRPIVLTPPEIKIFERVMRKKLTMHFEVNEFFKSSQHGFRKHRSCLTQLLFHTQNIFDQLLSNYTVDSLYIDYAKAFDKVDHSILMQKLELYGVSDEYLVWIKSFLTNRKQVVFINNACSYEVEVVSGVPQGSVLGPLFFITATNDLPDHISHCSLLSFADDTKLVLPINTSEDTQLLKKDLQSVISWSFNNNMELNKSKFELVTHRITKENPNLAMLDTLPFSRLFSQYEVDKDFYITPSKFVKDLGIIISDDLDWENHITRLCKGARRISAWILNVFYTRDRETMLTLFNSLVRPRLEYCCPIWDPSKIKLINLIEQIQRNFTFKITNMDNYDYWTRLSKLGITSLQRRREKFTITLVWKIKNNLIPNDINLEFKINKRNSQIRAVVKPLPRVRGKLLSSYENSFAIRAAKLFNKLPSKLMEISSLPLFKSRLEQYLSFYTDNPPVNGYYHRVKNSITDYRTVSYDSVFK